MQFFKLNLFLCFLMYTGLSAMNVNIPLPQRYENAVVMLTILSTQLEQKVRLPSNQPLYPQYKKFLSAYQEFQDKAAGITGNFSPKEDFVKSVELLVQQGYRLVFQMSQSTDDLDARQLDRLLADFLTKLNHNRAKCAGSYQAALIAASNRGFKVSESVVQAYSEVCDLIAKEAQWLDTAKALCAPADLVSLSINDHSDAIEKEVKKFVEEVCGMAATFKQRKNVCAIECAGCATCGKSQASLLCGRCKKVFYCNSECQRKNWPEHKIVCGHSVPPKPIIATVTSSEAEKVAVIEPMQLPAASIQINTDHEKSAVLTPKISAKTVQGPTKQHSQKVRPVKERHKQVKKIDKCTSGVAPVQEAVALQQQVDQSSVRPDSTTVVLSAESAVVAEVKQSAPSSPTQTELSSPLAVHKKKKPLAPKLQQQDMPVKKAVTNVLVQKVKQVEMHGCQQEKRVQQSPRVDTHFKSQQRQIEEQQKILKSHEQELQEKEEKIAALERQVAALKDPAPFVLVNKCLNKKKDTRELTPEQLVERLRNKLKAELPQQRPCSLVEEDFKHHRCIIIDDPSNFLKLYLVKRGATYDLGCKNFSGCEKNVAVWFTDPVEAFIKQESFKVDAGKRYAKGKQERLRKLQIHRFSSAADTYISECGFQSVIHDNSGKPTIRVEMPCLVCYTNNKLVEKSLIVYLINSNNKCYHRNIEPICHAHGDYSTLLTILENMQKSRDK